MQFETEMSRQVFESKYMLPQDKTYDDAVERIISVVKKHYPDKADDMRTAIHEKKLGIAGGLWRSANNINKNVSAINCTTLEPPEDNLESIANAWYWWAKFAAVGQGEGVDISKLRPRGSSLHNSAQKSTGAVSFMHTFDGVLSTIAQQGRRGASLISINIKHPDVPEFITVKDKEGVIETANISIHITDEFMNAVVEDKEWEFSYTNEYETISKKTSAKQLFKFLAEHAWISADPGVQFIDTVKKYSNSDYLGYPVVSTNACSVVAGTLIQTKDGLLPIENLVNKTVQIYDGNEWVNNSFFRVTGVDQDVYEVTLNNGVSYKVTTEHRFILQDDIVKTTLELTTGDRLQYDIENSIYNGSHSEPGAYLKGFMLGDGTTITDKQGNTRPSLWLYEPKYMCETKLRDSFYEMSQETDSYRGTAEEFNSHIYESHPERKEIRGLTSRERNSLYKWCSDYKKRLPNEVYNWDEFSKLELIAGLLDADGTSLDNKNGFGYQLSMVHKEFLQDFLILLSTIGVYGKLSKSKNEGYKEIKGQTYFCQDVWRVTIPQRYAIILSEKVAFQRLPSFKNRTVKYSIKHKYNIVDSVVKVNEKADKVYCTTIPSTGKFLTNTGIMTGNSEQWLDPHNVCLLSSLVLANMSLEEIPFYTKLMVYGLDAFRLEEIIEERSPSKIQMEKLQKLPRIGLGVTGLADYFVQRKIRYDSEEALVEAQKIFSSLVSEAYKTSYEIAKNNGKSFDWYDKEKYKQSPFIQNLLKEGLIEDYHLDYQAHVCKTTVAPNGTLTEITEVGGGGIEPIFAKYYVRRERSTTGDWKEWFTFNHLVRHELEKKGLEVTRENVDKYLIEDYWSTAHNIDNSMKIKLMAVVQKYIDSAISVTYNLPETATPEDIEKIYFDAWKQELKAVSVFREGCKPGVLITEANYESSKKLSEGVKDNEFSRKRPETVACDIHKMKVSGQPHLVLVGLIDGKPYEVFATHDQEIDFDKHKTGFIKKIKKGRYDLVIENGEEKTYIEDISKAFDSEYGTLSRMISMSLRHETPLPFVVDQLSKDYNFGGFAKSVSRVLKKYIKEGEKVKTSDLCDVCNSALVYASGCKTCPSCGWSKCD